MSKKHPAPGAAAPINPAPTPEQIAAGPGAAPGPAEPLPAAVVSPEEQLLDPAEKAPGLNDAAAKTGPAIPDDAALDALSNADLAKLARAYGLPVESRGEDIAALKKVRGGDGVQLQAHGGADVSEGEPEGEEREVDFMDGFFDPENPREFDPTVVLLHLERDGIIVEGYIDPFTGEGTRKLMTRLQDELVKARAKAEADGQPIQGLKVMVGEAPDPNALRRQRAAAIGHDIDPETKHCRKCRNAEWWCLDGHPCEPVAVEAPAGDGAAATA